MQEEPRVLRSERAFEGRVFNVRLDYVLTGGKEQRIDVVEHPGSFAIAALTDGGRLVLVQQYRHAAGATLWEIPAGTADGDESCEDGARRELREETGYSAESLESICTAYPTPGFCNERMHLYLARGLRSGEQDLDEDEAIEVRDFSLAEVRSMQADGQIADMKTMLALLWLEGKGYK